MRQKPQIRSITPLAQSRLFTIEGVDLVFSNGEEATFERIVSFGPAVMVVPITAEGLLMIREYAAGTDRYELGFVKGKIDHGESPEQAARRELNEEVGLGAHELHYVREMHGIPHYSNFLMHLFFAENLYTEILPGDEVEPLEREIHPLDKIGQLVTHSEINDPRVLTALMLVEKWLEI